MSAYRICEECGAALDPGERCDCQSEAAPRLIQPGSAQRGGQRMRSQDIKKPPAGWRPRRGQVSQEAYRENVSIIPQECPVCKGVLVWRRH